MTSWSFGASSFWRLPCKSSSDNAHDNDEVLCCGVCKFCFNGYVPQFVYVSCKLLRPLSLREEIFPSVRDREALLNSSFKWVITNLVGLLGLSKMGVVASVSARTLSPISVSMHLRR